MKSDRLTILEKNERPFREWSWGGSGTEGEPR